MQCACAILSTVTCPALQYISTLSPKRHDFRRKVTEDQMRVLFLSTTFLRTFLILRRTERAMIKNAYFSLCKVRVIIVRV